jgi:hypothetical protein
LKTKLSKKLAEASGKLVCGDVREEAGEIGYIQRKAEPLVSSFICS